MDKVKVHYRIIKGNDYVAEYPSLEAALWHLRHVILDGTLFDYVNVCTLDECGNEEIAFTGAKEILNAR